MRFIFYTHSLVSDWNHGNAHFLRGIMREVVARGHQALALEPEASWSRRNLVDQEGQVVVGNFARSFPELASIIYDDRFEHGAAVDGADVVVVHEWTDPSIVAHIGQLRRSGGRFRLLFHDTHHRAVSDQAAIAGMVLDDYDGILAFGEALRGHYLDSGWGSRVFTWHEAADVRLFKPEPADKTGDLVWIGNWGDGERSSEIERFLIEPAKALRLSGTVHGVRYPDTALMALADAGLNYRGWIANAEVPRSFAQHRLTMHIPRRPYVEALPGIPTIRVFEALACGIPLICAPWDDAEGLFRPGQDYLTARDGNEMQARIRDIMNDPALAASLIASGLDTIRRRHTCQHRVDELFSILAALDGSGACTGGDSR
jgi:spore maturation protein CgeB